MKQAYHHKDLRNALVEEALRVLASDGPSALTLRELARRLGVTHAAPYAHFADKGALLEAVANVGFDRLARALVHARDTASDPARGFKAMGHAYVEFACASPDLYRLMFADPALHDCEPDMSPEGEAAFGALVVAVVALGPHSEEEARLLSVVAWAMVHGIAMLEIDRRIAGKLLDARESAAIVDRSTDLFVAGLGAAAAPIV